MRPRLIAEMFVLYVRPRDYPEHVIVRRWTLTDVSLDFVVDRGMPCLMGAELRNVRFILRALHPGLARAALDRRDDPQIAEIWWQLRSDRILARPPRLLRLMATTPEEEPDDACVHNHTERGSA